MNSASTSFSHFSIWVRDRFTGLGFRSLTAFAKSIPMTKQQLEGVLVSDVGDRQGPGLSTVRKLAAALRVTAAEVAARWAKEPWPPGAPAIDPVVEEIARLAARSPKVRARLAAELEVARLLAETEAVPIPQRTGTHGDT
jgi:hypothetical protein